MRLLPTLLASCGTLFIATAALAQNTSGTYEFILTKEMLVCIDQHKLMEQFDRVFASSGQNQELISGCDWFDPPLRLVEDELGVYMEKGFPVTRHDHSTIMIGQYECTLVEFTSEIVNGFACADLIHNPDEHDA